MIHRSSSADQHHESPRSVADQPVADERSDGQQRERQQVARVETMTSRGVGRRDHWANAPAEDDHPRQGEAQGQDRCAQQRIDRVHRKGHRDRCGGLSELGGCSHTRPSALTGGKLRVFAAPGGPASDAARISQATLVRRDELPLSAAPAPDARSTRSRGASIRTPSSRSTSSPRWKAIVRRDADRRPSQPDRQRPAE